MIEAADARDNESVTRTGRLALGPLSDDQNTYTYPLPAHFQPKQFRAVTVWSERYGVNFTTAPLQDAKWFDHLRLCGLLRR
jgi:hypothetical protein